MPSTRPIAVLHPITRLIVGGAQENTLYTAERLPAERYRVSVLSGPQTGAEGSLIEEARQRGIDLQIDPHLLRQISPLNDLRSLISQIRLMRRQGYTIVHTHSSKAGMLGRVAARLAGTPVIIHSVHGWSFHDYMSPVIKATYILLERLCASFTDALICVSAGDIDKGLRAGIGRREQYHLIRSAIPLETFDPALYDRAAVRAELGLPTDAVVLGNVGRFSAQKNPLEWVRAAAEVAQQRPQVRLLLVGDGPLRAEVSAALAAHGLLERAILPGLQRDVPRWMAAMDIFLLTSLWEGLPRVIPQALAMGLPVVANRADGTVEAIQDGQTGYLCQPGDLPALSAACLRLVDDASTRSQMGRQGQSFARREFDLNVMIAQIERLYQSFN